VVAAVVGVVLILNIGRSADRLAALARPWPWWLRGWAGSNPVSYRIVGVLWVLLGALLVADGMRR
jgi:hypothetical protein